MNIGSLTRLARTVRHLRTSQLFWRGRYAVERRLPAPHIRLPRAANGTQPVTLRTAAEFPDVPLFHRPDLAGGNIVEHLAKGEFVHLNHCGKVGRQLPDWKLGPQSQQRLWAITLHYHGWVYSLAELIRGGDETAGLADSLLREYLTDWIDRCDLDTPGVRDLAWNAFAISTRISWWIRSYLLLDKSWWQAHAGFESKILRSLWRQAEYLNRHLEWDLRANHLLRNAVGLAWAGRFFSGREPSRWLERATSLAVDQAREQVLADGGHFERSPMYHMHVMEDLLSLALLLKDDDARQTMRNTWSAMADFLAWMRHPDGQIPLLNDSALNAVCDPARMLALGRRIAFAADARRRAGGRHFPDTGLAVWHGRPWSVFFDAGEVGPDCQPGHAHADTLSLECSYDGARLFVDPGTFGYDDDLRRRYDRSTAAHNTVCIDDTNSSEVWHIFRVGSRARPLDVQVDFDADSMTAAASHNGYDHLPGSPRHTRRLQVRNGDRFQIVDHIQTDSRHKIEGGYLLAPQWSVKPRTSGWELTNGRRRVYVMIRSGADLRLRAKPGTAHLEYGHEMATTRIGWHWEGSCPLEVTTVIYFS